MTYLCIYLVWLIQIKKKERCFPTSPFIQTSDCKEIEGLPGSEFRHQLTGVHVWYDAHPCKLGSASNRFSILVGGDCLQLTPSFCQPTADCGCTANILFVAGCWGSAKLIRFHFWQSLVSKMCSDHVPSCRHSEKEEPRSSSVNLIR